MGTSGLGCRESEAEAPDLAEVALGRRNLQATSWAGTFLIVLALLKNPNFFLAADTNFL